MLCLEDGGGAPKAVSRERTELGLHGVWLGAGEDVGLERVVWQRSCSQPSSWEVPAAGIGCGEAQ